MEVEISFRIFHPNISPILISDALCLEPRHFWAAGEPRKTPGGKPLNGINKETFWNLYIEHGGDKTLSEIISEFLAKLLPKKNFLQSMNNSGGRCEFFIGIMPTNQVYGDVLNHDLLGKLSDFGIDLAISFYNK